MINWAELIADLRPNAKSRWSVVESAPGVNVVEGWDPTQDGPFPSDSEQASWLANKRQRETELENERQQQQVKAAARRQKLTQARQNWDSMTAAQRWEVVAVLVERLLDLEPT